MCQKQTVDTNAFWLCHWTSFQFDSALSRTIVFMLGSIVTDHVIVWLDWYAFVNFNILRRCTYFLFFFFLFLFQLEKVKDVYTFSTKALAEIFAPVKSNVSLIMFAKYCDVNGCESIVRELASISSEFSEQTVEGLGMSSANLITSLQSFAIHSKKFYSNK